MKIKFILTTLFIFSLCTAFGQINMADSSVQVIGYWNIGDKQSFDITYEKYKVKGEDTTAGMMISYEVDVTVKDSTENTYIIEWFYKNYQVDTDNPLVQKIAKASDDISVLIKTDELGSVLEVVNWEEVQAYMVKAMKPLQEELKEIPAAMQILEQSMAIFSSKAAIEANAIKDAIQFYSFHGGGYTLNEEIEGEIQFANNMGGKPFDAEVALSLDEINEEDDNFVIRMYQSINSEQLTKVTYDYLLKVGTFGDKIPTLEEFPPLANEVWTASQIHGSTGWPLFSIETKEVSAEGVMNVEERIIRIK